MTDKIAIVGLVIGLLSGVAVPVGLAMLDQGAESGADPDRHPRHRYQLRATGLD